VLRKLAGAAVLVSAALALSGCGLRADAASHFKPRSVVPGVVVTTQSTGQNPADASGIGLHPPAPGDQPNITARVALAKVCPTTTGITCRDGNPTRIILARTDGDVGGTGDRLMWVLEWDNLTSGCPPSFGPSPVAGATPQPAVGCVAYDLVDAHTGAEYGTLFVGG
jgi:hypothetical protein